MAILKHGAIRPAEYVKGVMQWKVRSETVFEPNPTSQQVDVDPDDRCPTCGRAGTRGAVCRNCQEQPDPFEQE